MKQHMFGHACVLTKNCACTQDTGSCVLIQKWMKNDTSINPGKWYWGLRGPTGVTSPVNLSKTSMTIPTWKKRLASIALWWIIHYSVEACAFETLLQKISHKPRQAFLKGRNEWGLINSKCQFPPWKTKLNGKINRRDRKINGKLTVRPDSPDKCALSKSLHTFTGPSSLSFLI